LLSGALFAAHVLVRGESGAFTPRSPLWIAGPALFIVCLLAGLALSRSRAGIVLGLAALASLPFLVPQHHAKAGGVKTRSSLERRIAFACVIASLVFAAQFGAGGFLSRLETGAAGDLRISLNKTAWEAVSAAWPLGTGFGSFVAVYAAVEKHQDVFQGFANRAHNDLAEFLLEAGLPGAVAILAFSLWLGSRFYRVLIKPDRANPTQLALDRASLIAVTLLVLHSLVDYPLRTGALSAVFAFFCAILAVPTKALPAGGTQFRPTAGGGFP
jgi:O-antigen ligase